MLQNQSIVTGSRSLHAILTSLPFALSTRGVIEVGALGRKAKKLVQPVCQDRRMEPRSPTREPLMKRIKPNRPSRWNEPSQTPRWASTGDSSRSSSWSVLRATHEPGGSADFRVASMNPFHVPTPQGQFPGRTRFEFSSQAPPQWQQVPPFAFGMPPPAVSYSQVPGDHNHARSLNQSRLVEYHVVTPSLLGEYPGTVPPLPPGVCV